MAKHELLLAKPADAEPDFAVDEVEGYLNSQRFLLRDRATGLFLLCGTPIATQYARVRLLSEPDEPMPPVVLIRVNPREIRIWQRGMAESLVQARALAEWLIGRFQCGIFTPEGEDISASLDAEYQL